ncbi:uncharacterized protein [Amphiura filiformis]|uniref:uncharacterized protein n=1 Tax=Amphiura filiformis TaxID=82378 RepID=UPI003B218CB4
MTVNQSPNGMQIVTPVTCRKAKSSQNALERWTHLEKSSARIRERLIFDNRFENFHLDRHQEDLKSSEEEVLRDIFRAKDHMKLSLIDLAQSKRQIRNSVCDYERKIRRGSHSPVFSLERDRLKKKERELRGLQARLQGPNSQLLAEHVQDELKMIEYRNSVGLNNLHVATTLPAIGTRVDPKFASLNPEENSHFINEYRGGSHDDFESYEKQDGGTSKSNNYARHQQMLPHSSSDKLVSRRDIESSDDKVPFERDTLKPAPIRSKKRPRHHHIINSHSRVNMVRESVTSLKVKKDMDHEPLINADFAIPLSPVPEEKPPSNKLNHHQLQNLEESMSLTSETVEREFSLIKHSSECAATDNAQPMATSIDEMTHSPVAEPLTVQEDLRTGALPPIIPMKDLPKKSKTSRCRTKMQRQLLKDKDGQLGVLSAVDIAASRRERHAQKRLAEVKMKTNKQINKVTASGNRRNPHHLDVALPRSRKTELEMDCSVPLDDQDRVSKVKKDVDGEVRLPPIRVDPYMLQELKRQRIKHRTECTKLPKLP